MVPPPEPLVTKFAKASITKKKKGRPGQSKAEISMYGNRPQEVQAVPFQTTKRYQTNDVLQDVQYPQHQPDSHDDRWFQLLTCRHTTRGRKRGYHVAKPPCSNTADGRDG